MPSACKVKPKPVSREAMAALVNYEWPGNVRELENAIERALVMGSSDAVLLEDLPESLLEQDRRPEMHEGKYHASVKELKKQLILDAVEQTRGNYVEAAGILGVHPNYLHRLIRNLGLKESPARICWHERSEVFSGRRRTESRQWHLQQAGGIEISSLPADGDMKVGAGSASGASAQADFLPAFHRFAFLHFKFGKMEVQGEKSLTVVDDDAIAFEIQEARQQHGAGIHGRDWGSGGNAEVEAEWGRWALPLKIRWEP